MKVIKSNLKMKLFSFIFLLLLCSCGKDGLMNPEMLNDQAVVTKSLMSLDTCYLGFDGDLNDPKIIWQNMRVYSLAYDRLASHLVFEDNLLNWDFESAAEVNVSPNIYNYVISKWKYSNEKIESGECSIEIDGIYYKLIDNKSKIKLLSDSKQIILERGKNFKNMGEISRYIMKDQKTGWIGLYINFEKSNWDLDGHGGFYLEGEGYYLSKYYSYIVFIPKPHDLRHELNYIVATNSWQDRDKFYEKLMNKQWAPLITTCNAQNFYGR